MDWYERSAAQNYPDAICSVGMYYLDEEDDVETAKRLAAAGMGVTFLPHSYLNLFSGVDNLACYPLDPALQASWKLVIGYPDGRLLSRCSKEFIRYLKQKMQPDKA